MPEAAVATPVSGDITLRFLELCQFRRLGKVQLDIDKKTTILVGANNSGKTSVLAALRHFLADGSPFGSFDISLSQWPKLRTLGRAWEALMEDPSTVAGSEDQWKEQLESILSAMPTLDLWFDAEAGMYHYVAPFLSKFSWKGGAVGVSTESGKLSSKAGPNLQTVWSSIQELKRPEGWFGSTWAIHRFLRRTRFSANVGAQTGCRKLAGQPLGVKANINCSRWNTSSSRLVARFSTCTRQWPC